MGMPRLISIVSAKGGVGKTVTTTNLAVAMAGLNRKVVAIDCNLTNPHLGLYFGTVSFWPVSLNNVLNGDASLEQAMHMHDSGVGIIPASLEPKDMIRLNTRRLKSRISRTFGKFDADVVLLDSSPGLTRESMLSLEASEEALFVATPHIPAIIDITKCIQQLKRQHAKPAGIVLNRVKRKGYELSAGEIEQFTNLPVLATIPEDDNMLKSTNLKAPLAYMNPRGRTSQAFYTLAAKLLGEEYRPPRRSLFSFFFNGIRK